jgi:hypothetical protein
MADIQTVVSSAVKEILSDQNYERSFVFYRFWFGVGQTHFKIPSDQIFDVIWNKRATELIRTRRSQPVSSHQGNVFGQGSGFVQASGFGLRPVNQESGHVSHKLIHPTAHSILRFASDAESDRILAPHNSGLQRRLSTKTLQDFFSSNLTAVWHKGLQEQAPKAKPPQSASVFGQPQSDPLQSQNSTLQHFYGDTNFIAHWANLGYVKEVDIRNHILQSLISHPKLYGHQADALIILFKLAGATFGAYVDPAVVDRCFKLLNANYTRDSTDWELFQVRAFCVVECRHRTKTTFQEVLALRERGWEGLPPPPVFTTSKPKPTGTNQKGPAATPVPTFLGLPSGGLKPRIPQPPALGSVATLETDTVPVPPITQSPSISIATLSDFTVTDTSDDEPPFDIAIADDSGGNPPIDPIAVIPHETFYFEDGSMEVLCRNTLFRIHTSVLSPTLLRFVGCLIQPVWLRQNPPMVAPAFCPQTLPWTSPLFSRLYIFPGKFYLGRIDESLG